MLKKFKRIIGIILILAFLFASFYIGYIKITDNTPNFFGFKVLRIVSDGMEPELNKGEIVIVKNIPPADLELGDVISYRAEKGYLKGEIVTHQISKDPYREDGVYYFTTRGIRPEAVDDPEFSEYAIIGKAMFKIPFLGTIYDFFTHWYGIIFFVILLIIIFADDILGVVQRVRERNNIEDDDFEHTNINDIRQSEFVINERLNEFEGIITNLDDPDL